MSASRSDVLARLRAIPRRDVPHPGEFSGAIRYPDLAQRFTEAVEAAGGRCVRLAAAAIPDALAAHDAWRAAKQVVVAGVAVEPEAGARLVDPQTVTRVHDLAAIDVAVLTGTLGVAENGAIWFQTADPALRAVLVTTQHLVLVLPAGSLVHTMHEAYPAIDTRQTSYGVFVAGPSKTADIEQSLVIGAHGPLSLLVLLTG